jgi:hypothetical protein
VLRRTTEAWLSVGIDLRDRVARLLEGIPANVEVVGRHRCSVCWRYAKGKTQVVASLLEEPE